ncbi:MAG: DUF4142 domain-containing protein [Armatimonadota bacterium]|nr:DUF4142 domain-containing protein [bacterium]
MRRSLITFITLVALIIVFACSTAMANGARKTKPAAKPAARQQQPASIGAGPRVTQPSTAQAVQPGMAMQMCAVGTIAVDDTSIYVSRAGQITKLDKNTLQIAGAGYPSGMNSQTAMGYGSNIQGAGPSTYNQGNIQGTGPSMNNQATMQNQSDMQMQSQQGMQGTGPSVSDQQYQTVPQGTDISGSQTYSSSQSDMNVQSGTSMQSSSTYSQQQMGTQSAYGMSGAGPGGMQCMMAPVNPIAVDSGYIYMLQGDTIVKIDKNTLAVSSSCTLPPISQATMAPSGAGPSEVVTSTPGYAMASPIARTQLNSLASMSCSDMEQNYMQSIIQAHANAISWSRLAQTKASRSELRDFASNLVDEETRANDRFSSFLQNWYGVSAQRIPPVNSRGQLVLNNLQSLSGRDFDIAYMQAMVVHLQDAIALSNFAQSRATHAELSQTIANMSADHSAELAQLKTWLSSWYNISS